MTAPCDLIFEYFGRVHTDPEREVAMAVKVIETLQQNLGFVGLPENSFGPGGPSLEGRLRAQQDYSRRSQRGYHAWSKAPTPPPLTATSLEIPYEFDGARAKVVATVGSGGRSRLVVRVSVKGDHQALPAGTTAWVSAARGLIAACSAEMIVMLDAGFGFPIEFEHEDRWVEMDIYARLWLAERPFPSWLRYVGFDCAESFGWDPERMRSCPNAVLEEFPRGLMMLLGDGPVVGDNDRNRRAFWEALKHFEGPAVPKQELSRLAEAGLGCVPFWVPEEYQ